VGRLEIGYKGRYPVHGRGLKEKYLKGRRGEKEDAMLEGGSRPEIAKGEEAKHPAGA